jgi:hypothetical protein
MRRIISDLCLVAALLLGIVFTAQAQFNSFPPGTFTSRSALDAAGGGGGNTVTFDAKVSALATANSTTVTNNNLTIGALNSTVLVGVVGFNDIVVPASVAMTWNGVSMTQVASGFSASAYSTVIFCLVAPATGNHALVASWTGTFQAYLDGLSFTNVNQTGGTTSCPNGTSNTGSAVTTSTVTVTSQTNNKVVAAHQQNAGNWGAINGTTISSSTALSNNYASNYNVGAATVNMTAAYAASGTFLAVGTDILHN